MTIPTTIVRGSTLFVTVVFKDQDGDTISPDSAQLRISYLVNKVRQSPVVIDMTEGDNSEWTGSFDTSPADAGALHWFAHADADPTAAVEGRVIVEANPANPQG